MSIERDQDFEQLKDIAAMMVENPGIEFEDGKYVYYGLDGRTAFAAVYISGAWSAWQAAKAQAVPEGYKLVPDSEINIMDMIYGRCPCGSSRAPVISDKEGYNLIHCFSCGSNKYIHQDY